MPKRPDGIVRAFGMSGAQIASDMADVESRYDVDLGFQTNVRVARRLENYDQFEKEIRQQALEISEFYEIFYCLENSIRSLISNTLKDAQGAEWWDTNCIPPAVKAEVKSRQQKEVDSSITVRSENNIDYTTFGELAQIINQSWDLFAPLFTSKQAVQRVLLCPTEVVHRFC